MTAMNATADRDRVINRQDADTVAIRAKVKGTNINEETLLATDYLNHFNEIVMLLEMIPDMPEMLEEAKAWTPKAYVDHFRDSTLSDRDLAIEAYAHAPVRYREPFDIAVDTIDRLVAMTLDQADLALAAGNLAEARAILEDASRAIQKLMDLASATIHGSDKVLQQTEIDALLGLDPGG